MKAFRMTLLAFLVVTIAVGALWFTSLAVTPKEAAFEEVLSEAKSGGYRLINTEDLWAHYKKDKKALLLVDTRQEWEYRTGHIKGALNFPMEPTWLSRWRKKTELKAFLGPDKNRLIVFY